MQYLWNVSNEHNHGNPRRDRRRQLQQTLEAIDRMPENDGFGEYGIDGAFVQRFANGLRRGGDRDHKDAVLTHCREGVNREGRAYAVMYDLSGLPSGGIETVIQDWKRLRDQMRIGSDSAYLHHRGKPLVAVWGVGFSDDRKYTLAECRTLIEYLKSDGCNVMLGIPSSWRELKRDAIEDASLHDVLQLADVLSPWTPGRYRSPAEVLLGF